MINALMQFYEVSFPKFQVGYKCIYRIVWYHSLSDYLSEERVISRKFE